MDNLCNHCCFCCKLIPVVDGKIVRDGVVDVFDGLKRISRSTAREISAEYTEKVLQIYPKAEFYTCTYLYDGYICINQETPEACTNFPSQPFALISEDCGYCGKIFLQNEEIKQKVRRYKEEIVYYEAMMKSDPKNKSGYEKIIVSLSKFIKKYSVFGSEDW